MMMLRRILLSRLSVYVENLDWGVLLLPFLARAFSSRDAIRAIWIPVRFAETISGRPNPG